MKKTLQNLIIGLLLLTINSNAQTTILITDAAKKNIIDCKIFGSSNLKDNQVSIDADGLHYGKCMTLNLVSRVDSALFIFIENGLMLMCDDTTTQDMIITKPIYVNLEPRQQKEVQLYAMCSEIHDGAPNIFTDYKIGSIADKNLVSILFLVILIPQEGHLFLMTEFHHCYQLLLEQPILQSHEPCSRQSWERLRSSYLTSIQFHLIH